ncbi:hypothetical protein RI129_012454 [Pyrocoelia pectoralis]|uniref:Sulfotransferase domain-containing protein n=1 Tax=Pyrocoelia pectoralis TaxID=417401 RepID=A0AAN7V696_9COLE
MFNQRKTEIADDEVGRIIKRDLTNEIIDAYLLFGEDRVCLPKYYEEREAEIENFEIRNDDVIVASFPRTGTTWTQEMVWLLKNDLDYEGAKMDINDRFPFFELPETCNRNCKQLYDELRNKIGTRFLKTHHPFSLLPKQIRDGSRTPKIIFLMRNPKDAFLSYHHLGLCALGWRANREDFAKVYLADKVLFGPYWKKVHGYWNMRHLPNLLILKYEEMVKDLRSVVQKTCAFLEKGPLSEEQLEKLCTHLSFKSMKSNPAVNYQQLIDDRKPYNPTINRSFIRSGKVQGYKEEMSPKLISEFDEWIKKNIENTDFDERYAYFGEV